MTPARRLGRWPETGIRRKGDQAAVASRGLTRVKCRGHRSFTRIPAAKPCGRNGLAPSPGRWREKEQWNADTTLRAHKLSQCCRGHRHENNRSPAAGIAGYARSLLSPNAKVDLPDDIVLKRCPSWQFAADLAFALFRTWGAGVRFGAYRGGPASDLSRERKAPAVHGDQAAPPSVSHEGLALSCSRATSSRTRARTR